MQWAYTDSRQYTHTHTHTHSFNGPFSGTTRVSRYQKGRTNLDFTEARDSEWQWHQLGHMKVCTSLQTDNHASTPPLSFLHAGCPSCRPTNSVKALKAKTVGSSNSNNSSSSNSCSSDNRYSLCRSSAYLSCTINRVFGHYQSRYYNIHSRLTTSRSGLVQHRVT